MRWLWGSVLCSTLFWLNVVPIFTPPMTGWVWLIVIAILMAGAGLRRTQVAEFSPLWLLLLVPLGFAVWAVPFPFNLPAGLAAAALILLATGRRSTSLAWVGLPLGFVGALLAVQMATLPVVYIISSRLHEISWLTPLFFGLVRIFELNVSLSGSSLIIHYVNDNFEFLTRPEALGFIPTVLFAVGGLAALASARRTGRTMLGFLALIAGYSAARYVFLVFVTVRTNSAGVFWLPLPTALSYLPLTVVLTAMFRPDRTSGGRAFTLRRLHGAGVVPAFALASAAVLGVIGFFAYHDGGIRKQGRILIDELHSDWEWTTLKYDTEWYGRKSGYNYYCLAEYLDIYYTVDASRDSLLPDLLADYDVVVLKTPTNPYSRREIAALAEYVRRGGGLWLIGDHTNVFGTSTYLNQVANRFGLRFRYDSTYDLRTMALSKYTPPPIFAHPIVRSLPTFLFATSCTMESPIVSENMILGYGLKAMDLDYGGQSFFPRKTNKNYGFGVFVQQGGIKYGKGRVAGFTDSTCFSNFFMFIPGKPELALATIEWLNRMNRFAWVNPVLLLGGLLSLAGTGLLIRRWARAQQAVLSIAAGFLGLAIAVTAYDGHVRQTYRAPEAHKDFTQVAFEAEHSAFTLPTMGLTKSPGVSLHTFYVWTQRLGFFPCYEKSFEDALAKGDLVVVANPSVRFAGAEIRALDAYLRRGGRLIVLVDPLNREQAQTELLQVLGLELDIVEEDRLRGIEREDQGRAASTPHGPLEEETGPGAELPQPEVSVGKGAVEGDSTVASIEPLDIVDLGGRVLVRGARPTGLSGGSPLLRLSDGRAVLVETTVGAGRVFVFSDFALFTVEHMGHTGEPVDRRRRAISELEYWMVREILPD